MKARELMLAALLVGVGGAVSYAPPAAFGAATVIQPQGGDAVAQGDSTDKTEKKKKKKKKSDTTEKSEGGSM